MKILSELFKIGYGVHIPGEKKHLYDQELVRYLEPKRVYIPLTNHVKHGLHCLVQVGDYVKMGQKIGERADNVYAALHASVSGTVVGIEKCLHRSGNYVDCVVIENDEQYTHADELTQACCLESQLSSEEIVDKIREGGIVGLGGSGFSTYVKYVSTQDIETIVLNGVECEPFIATDHNILLNRTDLVFEGLKMMMHAAKAERGVIAIKQHKKPLFDYLTNYAKDYPNISIVEVPDAYPMGWEKVLIRQVFRKEYDRLPADVGLVVNNVATAVEVASAVRGDLPLIYRTVTINGPAVAKPQILRVRVGTKANEVLALAGYKPEVAEVRLIAGGPMMGNVMENDEFIISKGVNAITCLIEETTSAKRPLDVVEQPCVRCAACVDNCPAGLQPVNIMMSAKLQEVEMLQQLEARACIECGLCSYVCPSKIPVTQWMREAKKVMNGGN
ncbi:MAG: electron transport complex subunit RsxC [Culicoidibacterales bacterium]